MTMRELEYMDDKMNEESLCFPIYEFPNFINDEEADIIIDSINKFETRQKILKNKEISKMIEDKIFEYIDKGKFPEFYYLDHVKKKQRFKFVGCHTDITISKHNAPYKISKHKDEQKNMGINKNLTKLLIYLNDDPENPDSGGTIFHNKEKDTVTTIKREKNKACIFDIRQYHSGETLVSGTKYLLGLRLMYVKY